MAEYDNAMMAMDDTVTPPLPDGWVEETDPSSGRAYYYNQESGKTCWQRPAPPPSNPVVAEKDAVAPPLPNAWIEATYPTSKETYYYNRDTGAICSQRPSTPHSAPAVAAAGSVTELPREPVAGVPLEDAPTADISAASAEFEPVEAAGSTGVPLELAAGVPREAVKVVEAANAASAVAVPSNPAVVGSTTGLPFEPVTAEAAPAVGAAAVPHEAAPVVGAAGKRPPTPYDFRSSFFAPPPTKVLKTDLDSHDCDSHDAQYSCGSPEPDFDDFTWGCKSEEHGPMATTLISSFEQFEQYQEKSQECIKLMRQFLFKQIKQL